LSCLFLFYQESRNSQLERISCLWYCMVNLFFLCCAKTWFPFQLLEQWCFCKEQIHGWIILASGMLKLFHTIPLFFIKFWSDQIAYRLIKPFSILYWINPSEWWKNCTQLLT
jgi:hypothetical protein